MKTIKILPVALALVLCVFSTVSAQKKEPRGAAALRAADAAWQQVFSAKDLKRSVDFCAPDGSVMAPNAPMATGKPAISQLFSAFFALPDFKISWNATGAEVARSGELGYTTGLYELSFKDPTGKVINDNGKYVTVWQQQSDGSWKVSKDIFNSNLPLPPAP
jgi:ketosteroid isomerase-like protein